jgi:hypothetical protein
VRGIECIECGVWCQWGAAVFAWRRCIGVEAVGKAWIEGIGHDEHRYELR